jgi:hypothetical protein
MVSVKAMHVPASHGITSVQYSTHMPSGSAVLHTPEQLVVASQGSPNATESVLSSHAVNEKDIRTNIKMVRESFIFIFSCLQIKKEYKKVTAFVKQRGEYYEKIFTGTVSHITNFYNFL